MKRAWRNGGRVLYAILAAAMIFTSLPVSGMIAYADETVGVEELVLEERVPAGAADEESAAAAEESSDAESSGETAAENEEPAAETTPADEEEPAAGTTPTDEELAENEAPSEGETTAEDETATADETAVVDDVTADEKTPADVTLAEEDPERTVSDSGYTILDAEEDYTWSGTTITGLNYEPESYSEKLSLIIPAKATAIGEAAFRSNNYICSVSFVGSNITSIGTSAFSACYGIEELTLPDGLEEIGDHAFAAEKSLTSVSIPGTVKSIGMHAFDSCGELVNVDLSEGLEVIDYDAFRFCSKLSSIDLPSTLTTLKAEAFMGTNLSSVTIPASVTSTIRTVFSDCDALETVYYAEGTTTVVGIKSTSLTKVVLPESVETIEEFAFSNCTALTSCALPSGLKEIGRSAFSGCSVLTNIELPDTLERIGWAAFGNCTGITSIVLPTGLTWEYYLEEDMDPGYGSINPFTGCTNLTYLEYAEGTEAIRPIGAYYVTTVRLPESATYIYENAFRNCTHLQTINIPASITEISESAFQNCSSLETIDLPELLTTIRKNTFKGCSSLQIKTLPEWLWEIEESAFEGCSALTDLEFNQHCSEIGDNAFKDCTGLETLRFAGSLRIQDTAFDGVTGDEDVLVYCSSGSGAYNYFIDKDGFRVISVNTIYYSLPYGANNNKNNPTSYTTGDDLTFYDPTWAGHEFRGWFTDYECKIPFVYDKNTTNGNLYLYAGWTEITYSITYDLNGGTLPGGATNPSTYTALRNVTLVAPTKEGAVFVGWKVNDTDEIITGITANTYAEDLTLTAQWREHAYQIIWNKNAKDATGTMDPVTLGYSESYTIPQEDYDRAGYDLAGWNTKANGKGTSYAVGDVVQGLASKDGATVTLYAQWQKSIYEIVYVLNDSVLSPATNHKSNPDSYNVGQKVKLQNPTRTGYTFGGWYTDAAYTEKVTQITSAMGDVTVYAKWTPITYTIVFNANKGTLPAGPTMGNLTATYDTEATLWTNAFVRNGYTFLGWDTTANSKAAEPVYKDGAKVLNLSSKNKAKVTLYAKWQINQIPITYVLNDTEEDPATNSSKNPAYVTIAKNVVLVAPTRAGYKFGGWYTDEALETPLAKNTIAKTTTEPVTVYASWIENSYTLKLDRNGGTYDIPKEVEGKLVVGKHEYEDEFLLPDGTGASRTNYEFTGWNTKKDRSGTHYGLNPETGENETVSGLATKGTVTLYAEWTPVEDKTYTITYRGIDDSWDNSKNPSVYSFEKDIKLANPTKAGYTFKGWYAEDPSANPKAKKVTSISKKSTTNIELYGVWTENSYTIAYNGNKGALPKGVKMAAQSDLYSQEATLTTNAFTRKGYEFDGWNTKANGKGTKVDGTVGNYADGEAVRSLTAKNKGKVTLYAQWKAVDYTITYVNAENGVDGVVNTNPATYTIAKDVKLVNPTAYGYTFKGWYADDLETNPKAKKVTKIAKTTCKDMTVYALWSENKYNLRFSTNSLFGSSVKSVTNRLYTEEFNIPTTEPTKEGCTFQGWALTRDGEAIFHAGDSVTFADIHDAGGTAKGLVGTTYFTLYAIFAEE